jgi:hypothetical protein
VNQNHLKHLFYRFTSVGQNLKTFHTNSPLKCFRFLLFNTVSTFLAQNQKCFIHPNGSLYSKISMFERQQKESVGSINDGST